MFSSTRWRVSAITAVVASGWVYLPAAIAQTAPTNAQLAHLVAQQAAQIKRLNARLDEIEPQQRQAVSPPVVKGVSSASSPDLAKRRAPVVLASDARQASNASMQQEIHDLQAHSVRVDWKSGAPKFSTPDGMFSFEPMGRIQYDFSTTNGSRFDSDGAETDLNSRNITGTEFRRVRLGFQGTIGKPYEYKVEMDFAGGGVNFRDVYIAAKQDFQLGQGVVYLGNKFADRGLDAKTSSNYTWFTDRNTVSNGIQPASGAYNTGITGEFYGKQDWHLSLAVTKGTISDANTSSNNFTVLSRGHWDPIDTGSTTVHVGAWGFYEDFDRQRQGPITGNVHIAGHYNGNLRVYGDTVDPDTGTGYGFELAGLTGPFAADAEYGRRDLNGRNAPDTHVDAYSGQIGYSLTGEAFGYSTKSGTWTHPHIAHPVTEGGIGAWQLMARYNVIDFNGNSHYAGGTGHGSTVGLSWYLTDHLRGLLDYTMWRTNNRLPIAGTVNDGHYIGPDDGNTINARAQVVF